MAVIHLNNMAKLLLLGCAWLNCLALSAHAQSLDKEPQFPYQAIVVTEDTAIRSGPGQVHYATGSLPQGATVEVYRHDPGGWCAIRPPKGSFSLVPAATLSIVEDGIGEVTEAGTQAWVGTQLGPVEQPLWQIKLKMGEAVEILGQANWPEPAGHSTAWYQIAPPAGEFRWVNINDLQLPPDQRNLSSVAYAGDRIGVGSAADSEVQPTSFQSSQLDLNGPRNSDANSANSGWRQARRPIDRSAINEVTQGSRGTFTGAEVNGLNTQENFSSLPVSPERLASTRIDPRFDMEQLLPSRATGNGSTNASPMPLGSYTGSQPLTARLTELEMKLNQEMIKEPNQWRLVDLQTAAQLVSDTTGDSIEQLQSQRLMMKLENCRKIRADYLKAFNINGGADANGAVGSGLTDEAFSLSTMYDAHGWLNELVRAGGTKQSTYVLQDDNGKITHHVSPGPGMNLSSYLKTKVGIKGQRGYHTELKLDHVTAERVIELDRNPIRR